MNKDKFEDILVLITSTLVCVCIAVMGVGAYLQNGDIAIGAMLAAVVVTLIYSFITMVMLD